LLSATNKRKRRGAAGKCPAAGCPAGLPPMQFSMGLRKPSVNLYIQSGYIDVSYIRCVNSLSRKLFATTLTELAAIAALAITGFRNPNAAAGIAITL
jgi:hypothetical protein